jgi:hypothetical protein
LRLCGGERGEDALVSGGWDQFAGDGEASDRGDTAADGGNTKEAAQILGIDRSTLYEKLKKYGIPK